MQEWTQQGIYEILQKNGLNGLLREFRLLTEKLKEMSPIDPKQESVKQALSLMESHILSKVLSSGKLFLLVSSDTNRPYIDCFDTEYDFRTYLFSNVELAKAYEKELLNQNYPTDIMEIVTGKHRESFFHSLMLAGARFVVLDKGVNQYVFTIERLTSEIGYDGYSGIEYPLVNKRLNAMLSEYVQDTGPRKVSCKLEEELFKALKAAYFTFPVFEQGEVDRLDHKEILYSHCMIQMETAESKTETIIPVFTDYESLDTWAEKVKLNEYTTLIAPFDKLGEIIEEYNCDKFLLNWDTHGLVLDKNLFVKIKNS